MLAAAFYTPRTARHLGLLGREFLAALCIGILAGAELDLHRRAEQIKCFTEHPFQITTVGIRDRTGLVAVHYDHWRIASTLVRIAQPDPSAAHQRRLLPALPPTYACHCLDCQTWTGAAFSQQFVVREEDLPRGFRTITPTHGVAGIVHNPNRINLILDENHKIVMVFWE